MDEQRVHTQAEGVLRTVKVLSSACQVMYYSDTSKETTVRNGRGFLVSEGGSGSPESHLVMNKQCREDIIHRIM